jgi:hypothetical protein
MSDALLRIPVLAVTITALACGGGSGDVTGVTPHVAVGVVADSQATSLGAELVSFTFHVNSVDGFHGNVTYAFDSLPASWEAGYNLPSPLVLTAGQSQDLVISIAVPTDGESAPAGRGLSLHLTTATEDLRMHFVLAVANEFILPIAIGTDSGPHWDGRFGTTLSMRVGSTLIFRNDDSVMHSIHTSASIPGFLHEANAGMAPFGGTYSSTFTGSGDDDFYCHAHLHSEDKLHLHVY